MSWRLEGYDTFSNEEYSLPGEYPSEEAAIAAALRRLKELEVIQPTQDSGGQTGIQDRVFVVRPDGRKFRVTASGAKPDYGTN